MTKNTLKRFLYIAFGALLSQGVLFLSYTYTMHVDMDKLGVISTALGIMSIALILIDFGGVVTLKQFESIEEVFNKVLNIVIIRLIIFILLTFIYFSFKDAIDPRIAMFLSATLTGLFFTIFNFTGLLDVVTKNSIHAVLSSPHLTVVGVALLFIEDSSYQAIGDLCTLSLIITYITHLFYVFLYFKSKIEIKRECRNITAESLKYNFYEGFFILLAVLPGQVVVRFFSVYLFEKFDSSTAAIYNYAKTLQGLFNQAITLIRRAEYPNLMAFKGCSFNLINWMKAQALSLLSGVLGMLSLFILIFTGLIELEVYLGIIIALQSLVWFAFSVYFVWLQIHFENKWQGFYGVMVVLFSFSVLFFNSLNDVADVFYLEIFASVSSFIALIVVKRLVFLYGILKNEKSRNC